MEKGTPHCKLSVVRNLVRERKVRITQSALAGAAALNVGPAELVATVLELEARDFYKSMTTHADHRIWQDVYRPTTKAGAIYLKLTVVEDVLVVSFKEW
ncbi:type II toxin-antitoxin system MqsR family toxin [Paraburkholderia sp. BL21I4N1]|uniref:type II toxin-antitoxin system MqsR family toxin n=1 Tax=Paraburkholderia sp. BL21I4N1 TaxID=1938801 RepID=UPI000CFCF086|nr:type II toxin-antitoxin system MqsR family toxin [Paraburkholderia sp. BL21I4N1]PQV48143.1 motility quorum-sensing regulator/GCU-specific mRNA interferase toxin [Paraburkholderia sp. BL21I4N1]